MARKAQTEADFRLKAQAHIGAMKAAIRSLDRSLSDDDVCGCDAGNASGDTEQECGCEHREAARVLEAGGCYIRRGLERGFRLS